MNKTFWIIFAITAILILAYFLVIANFDKIIT
jgi:hypothetical protein